MEDHQKITEIRKWLGTGSINVFGLPFSGKNHVGRRLSELLGAVFISSGEILRESTDVLSKEAVRETNNGELTPTDEFKKIVLPYFSNPVYRACPLVLSSIGRWSGEEVEVVKAAEKGGHPIRIVLLLNVSEDEVRKRWHEALESGTDERLDDRSEKTVEERLSEFNHKTLPVINTYHSFGILISINGHQELDDVVDESIKKLYEFVTTHTVLQGEMVSAPTTPEAQLQFSPKASE